MKKLILNIFSTTGISLLVLSLVATFYGGTVICIDTIFQVLGLNVVVFIGLQFIEYFEYHYPILETGLKLAYIIVLVLIFGLIFGWYSNLSGGVLILMTIGIFIVCVFLDTISLLGEVKSINGLIVSEGSDIDVA